MPNHVDVPEEAVKAEFERRLGRPQRMNSYADGRLADLIRVQLAAAAPAIIAKAVEEKERRIHLHKELRDDAERRQRARAAEATEVIGNLRAEAAALVDRAEKAEQQRDQAVEEKDAEIERLNDLLHDCKVRAEDRLERLDTANAALDSLGDSYNRMKVARAEALRERDQAVEAERERMRVLADTLEEWGTSNADVSDREGDVADERYKAFQMSAELIRAALDKEGEQ